MEGKGGVICGDAHRTYIVSLKKRWSRSTIMLILPYVLDRISGSDDLRRPILSFWGPHCAAAMDQISSIYCIYQSKAKKKHKNAGKEKEMQEKERKESDGVSYRLAKNPP